MSSLTKMTESQKREMIYLGERLKEITAENAALIDERGRLNAVTALDEAHRRRKVYIAERQNRLQQERTALLETRKALSELG